MDKKTASLPTATSDKIAIFVPVYGKMDVPFHVSLMNLVGSPWLGTIEYMQGDSLVNRARNNCANKFLKGSPIDVQDEATGKIVKSLVKFDWMLFLDSDLAFTPEDVERLYRLGVKRGPGVYAGVYPLKQIKPKVVFNASKGKYPDAEGVCEVREAGTGFMLIHREVFEKMKEKFRDEIEYLADTGDVDNPREVRHDFFTVGVRMDPVAGWKRFLSADWYFCQRWREIGGTVVMHTGIEAKHIGTMVFPVPPQEILETAAMYQEYIAKAQAEKSQPVTVHGGAVETAGPEGWEMPKLETVAA